MDIDKVTFNDLSIFNPEEEYSIFHKLNFTRTRGGRDWLVRFFSEPFDDVKRIVDTQQILQSILRKEDEWPQSISNGTIMVMERFYDTPLDTIPSSDDMLSAYTYRILHAPDFSLIRYSIGHFADFVRGFRQLISMFSDDDTPAFLKQYIKRADSLLRNDVVLRLGNTKPGARFKAPQTIYYGHYLLYHFKNTAHELINIYGRLDAWYSMAMAMKKFHLTIPQFIDSDQPYVEAGELYHLLLPSPVSYNVKLDPENNFLFLTGANMAGKSTFIKSVGGAVYLAHIGMGVPASSMKLTLFHGILSNINVVDNIVKGESYFFNEVQRIKNTILKINDQRKWLVLIDELFKGTNVQDAMKCSLTVIKGLIRIKNSLFILSTHLYEIGEDLKGYPNICFRYFETNVKDDQLDFSYQLKEGISNDRLGYLILRREKVVDLLENI
ncbi:MAG: DNA mismatch repair protein MutS [Williamsia sp.]|nr:DNA mismatch repair protein MutS [Williamsia sp.]